MGVSGITFINLPSNYKGMYLVSDLPICIVRLKPKASKPRGPLATVSNIFGTVIGISYIYHHSALKSINNPSVICSSLIKFLNVTNLYLLLQYISHILFSF
jgi:hypothetical protein